MKLFSTFFILTALVIAGCNPKVELSKDLALADSLLKAADVVYNTKDAQKMTNLYADDALIIAMGKSYWGRDSIYALFKTMAPLVKSYKSFLGPVTVSKDLVQMQKYYLIDVNMGGSPMKAKGVASQIWKKQPDNTWKIDMFVEFIDMKPY